MQLLANCPLFPSVLLLLAKSVPVSSSSSNEGLLAHCSGDFYFDATNQILYLSEAKLQHVGHFIATILQSMAHIASGKQKASHRWEPWNPVLCTGFATVMYSSDNHLWKHNVCNLLWKQYDRFFFKSRIQTPELYASSPWGHFSSKPSAVQLFFQMDHSRGV